MNKITIKDVINANQPISSVEELKEAGFEKGCNCKEIESVVNKLEIDLAKKRLTHKERQIIGLIEIGYTYKQIEEELGVNAKTVRTILDKMGK
jgi:DNA-binding NarL/FixJ family response regulator